MTYVHKMYEYDYNSGRIKPKNMKCPRCGSYMAFHKKPIPRWACGKCYYTEFIKTRS